MELNREKKPRTSRVARNWMAFLAEALAHDSCDYSQIAQYNTPSAP